ncbi:hypothetical protein EV363DRAFT_490538 [Boletus edulis]|uniref:Uncharacterized protein n=1 Tax=Boletus edulis BED1 TaxID=1328754 RepID=A0AAD4G917_BOLED|nr:hypothetical protein EV363DRAFT_490538 [Boletus edulis]KAF8430566.1 hypothetical protein L210DRAFT_3067244 [Boletus edulis BED1]
MVSHRAVVCHVSLGLILGNHHHRHWCLLIFHGDGAQSSSPHGALAGSITRAWTLQEYIAARVICFSTEDWILYRDLNLPNHKESPELISEMEEATGMSSQRLMTLRPGLKCHLGKTASCFDLEDDVDGRGCLLIARLLAYPQYITKGPIEV